MSREQWDSRFAAADYIFGTEPNAFLRREAGRIAAGSDVLAVADGEGRNGVWLARQGHQVTAVDISAVGQRKAANLASRHGVSLSFHLADLTTWAWPVARYDAIVAIFIQFAGPADRATLFSHMRNAVKPGGLILLEGYRPEQLGYGTGGPPIAENMYDEAMLRAAFAGFEILSLTAYDAEIAEGSGHHGQSALIDLVARRPLAP